MMKFALKMMSKQADGRLAEGAAGWFQVRDFVRKPDELCAKSR